MANVFFAARRSTVAAFTSVTAAADAVTNSVTAISDVAQAGAIKARQFREDIEMAGEFGREERIHRVRRDAQMKAATHIVEHAKTLDSDPALARVYEQLNASFEAAETRARGNITPIAAE